MAITIRASGPGRSGSRSTSKARLTPMKLNNALAITALAAFATSACVDLDVANPNDADAQRALRTAGDVESLIAGSFVTWWNSSGSTNGIAPILMTVAYGNSATAANFGMVEFSGWPKVPVHH